MPSITVITQEVVAAAELLLLITYRPGGTNSDTTRQPVPFHLVTSNLFWNTQMCIP